LDPDKNGAVVWKVNVAKNPPGTPLAELNGIVWGGAADEQNVYYGLTGGGVVAIRLADGERKWFMPMTSRVSNGAAASAIPGVAFVGGMDGKLHALATEDGHSLWQYDTAHEFTTVNQVPAKGGGMGSAGATIAGGMLFVGSGYGVIGGSPGNVLLAFGVE
jgi:polyvinyl alcohol dehydrogenase (cytochrome)